MSGFGTYSKQKEASVSEGRYGVFDTPRNHEGMVSKATKLAAEHVDNELLYNDGLVQRIMDDERENCLRELTVDQWNEIYAEVTQDLNRFLAQQLVEDRKQDIEFDYQLN